MFTTAINKHIVFLQTLNFFSLCHTRDIDSKFLTDMRVCLYGYEVGFDLQYNPITRNIKHYVVTDEELSDLKITETTALIILLPVDGLVSCGHWALLYCFRSSNKKFKLWFDSINPGVPQNSYVNSFLEENSSRKIRTHSLKRRLQALELNTCGYWCLHALTYFIEGYSITYYQNKFRRDSRHHNELKMLHEFQVSKVRHFFRKSPCFVLEICVQD